METLETTPAAANEAAARRLAPAMREEDYATMAQVFAPDVVIESPVTAGFRFRGREDAVALMRIVRGRMESLEHFELLGSGELFSQRFGARVGGRDLDGVDVLRINDSGQVSTMTVFIRPLPGLTALAAAVVPPVARRRARLASVVVRVMLGPLAVMTAYGDRFVRRLLRGSWGIGA